MPSVQPTSPLSSGVRKTPKLEVRLVALLTAVQLVNVLDFVIVMPLGPDFAVGLGIPTSYVGWIAGSYTLAAAFVGLLGSFMLDRFERRKALAVALAGLVISTAGCGLSNSFSTLIVARVLAGMFGGPATALAMALVTDSVPVARRGRALGIVMMAFSVASVLGVPAGLEIARLWGWRMAFYAVALLGAGVTVATTLAMPSAAALAADQGDATPPASRDRGSLAPASVVQTIGRLFEAPAITALLATFFMTMGVFILVPNLSAYVQYNLGYPRESLGTLYLVGGVASFVSLRWFGRWVDRFGSGVVFLTGTVVHSLALWFGFVSERLVLPALALFVLYMVSGSIRMVAVSTLSTRVPAAEQRAGFLSVQSAIRHAGSALGSAAGAALLSSSDAGQLNGMGTVASIALALAWLAVPLLWRAELRVLRRG